MPIQSIWRRLCLAFQRRLVTALKASASISGNGEPRSEGGLGMGHVTSEINSNG